MASPVVTGRRPFCVRGTALNNRILKPWLWVGLALAANIVSWSYTHRVLRPWESYVNVTRGQLKAQMGDLYSPWVGTRELLLNGRNPYGPEVSHEIQDGFYRHPLDQNYAKPSSQILDEQRFAYPVYVVFLLAPTVHMEFSRLQHWAGILFAVLTALSVWLWLSVLQWRSPGWVVFCAALFTLATPQIAQGLRLRQLGLLVAFLIAVAAWLVVREHYFLGGILLAISTIKPQMVVLCIAWLFVWSLGEWKRRWPLVAGFSGMLGVLTGAGLYVAPDWPRQFLEGLQAYRRYVPTTSLLRLILGDWAGGALSIMLVIAFLTFAWHHRKVSPESHQFANTVGVVLIVTSLVLPLLTPYNQMLLLLPALILLQDWNRLPRAGRVAFITVVGWPWISSLVLLIHPPSIESTSRLPLLPSWLVLLFPFLIGWLMFVRLQQAD